MYGLTGVLRVKANCLQRWKVEGRFGEGKRKLR